MVLGESCTLIIVQWWYRHHDDQTDRQTDDESTMTITPKQWLMPGVYPCYPCPFLCQSLAQRIFLISINSGTMLLWQYYDDGWRQVTLHVALVHSFVNPSLFIVLHRGIRQVDQIDFIGPKSAHCLALPCQSVTKVSFCSYWDKTDVTLACEDSCHLSLPLFIESCYTSCWSLVQILKAKFCQNLY